MAWLNTMTEKLHSNKKPQRQYPGSRLNLLPVLDIKDSPFQDNIDNPTTITFTPISAVPPQRIPYLHSKTLGYPQQDCNDGMPTCQNSLGVSPSTNSNGQGTEGRGTTYKLNTAGTGSVLLHQCSSDNSTWTPTPHCTHTHTHRQTNIPQTYTQIPTIKHIYTHRCTHTQTPNQWEEMTFMGWKGVALMRWRQVIAFLWQYTTISWCRDNDNKKISSTDLEMNHLCFHTSAHLALEHKLVLH